MAEMNADAYRESVAKHFVQGNYDQVIKDLSEAIRLNPNDSLDYVVRAEAYWEIKDYSNAWKDVNEAIRLDPNNALAYADRGLWKRETAYGYFLFFEWVWIDEYRDAVADLEMAVKLQPDDKVFQQALKKAQGPYLHPGPALILLGSVLAGIIIEIIKSHSSDISVMIGSGIGGGIIGVFFGLGIIPWLSCAKKALLKIPDTFGTFKTGSDAGFEVSEGGGIIKRIKSLLLALLLTVLWVPIKLFLFIWISPIIGIIQCVRLLIEKRKLKKQAAQG
jgi:tetratricopeptide (TPR) repeat protein